jgi:hypothetical protein
MSTARCSATPRSMSSAQRFELSQTADLLNFRTHWRELKYDALRSPLPPWRRR